MPRNAAIDILAEIGTGKAPRSTSPRLADLPKPVRGAIDKWLTRMNLEIGVITDPVRKVTYGPKSKSYYIVEFYSDDAEIYTGTLIFQGATLAGESSGGSS